MKHVYMNTSSVVEDIFDFVMGCILLYSVLFAWKQTHFPHFCINQNQYQMRVETQKGLFSRRHVFCTIWKKNLNMYISYPHFLRPWPYEKTWFGSKVKQGILLFDALSIAWFRRRLVRYTAGCKTDIWARNVLVWCTWSLSSFTVYKNQ